MEIIRIIGIGLISLIIILVLRQYKPEFAIYVSLITGILILFISLTQISGVIDLLKSFASRANINTQFISLLLKITGIAFLTEFAVSISNDCGETAIANKSNFYSNNNSTVRNNTKSYTITKERNTNEKNIKISFNICIMF